MNIYSLHIKGCVQCVILCCAPSDTSSACRQRGVDELDLGSTTIEYGVPRDV